MLEVIDKAPALGSDKTPLLLVHGAWHGAWCWDEHFLDYVAAKGCRSLAVSLRGHGKSPAPKSIRFCSIADFVDDVASVASSLPLLEPGWAAVAERIHAWLETRCPTALPQ
jgi:pimeloyl-ACP methyl ester carboxylesterase